MNTSSRSQFVTLSYDVITINTILFGEDDDLDLDDDKVRLSLHGPAEEGFSPAVDQSARKELEPMNLTFTP